MILPTAWLIAFGLLPTYNPALYDPLWQPPSYDASSICSNYVPPPERCQDKSIQEEESSKDFFSYQSTRSSWWNQPDRRERQAEE